MLINAKLRPPQGREGLLRRDRLLDQLQASLDRPLTLVSAPAGFGKTTLLSSWLDICTWPSAWLSIDEDDSDLFRFMSYLLAAVRTVFPDALDSTGSRLDEYSASSVPALAGGLIEDLERLERPFVLILDDYHLIHDPAVHQVLAELLRHPLRSLHLVLSTRQDPPLPLGPLRAQNRLGELRSRDLRLTSAEIAAFLQQTLGHTPDATSLSILAEKTEGWVAGLRLAALSLSAAHDLDASVAALTGDNRYVMDYLLAEVLLRQPPARQEFLLKTAILERLSGPLCDALLPPGDPAAGAQRCLAELAAANLFTEALDDQQQWFRYHPLFRQLLLHQLPQRYTPAQIALCHARASAWYAQQGLIEEALEHAWTGEDPGAVADLLSLHRHALLSQEQWPSLERWLQRLPAPLVEMQPELLLSEAWLAYHRGLSADLRALLEQAEALLAQQTQTTGEIRQLQGEIAALRCHLSYQASDATATIGFARSALAATPPTHAPIRNFARLRLAAALQMSGDLHGAHAAYYEGLRESEAEATSFAHLEAGFGLVSWVAGDLSDVTRWASHFLESRQSRDLPESAAWANYWLARAHYQHDNLAEAELRFNAALADPQAVQVDCYLLSAIGLALTYQAQHRPEDARQVLRSVMPFLLAVNNLGLMPLAAAFGAELALLQKDVRSARRWAASFTPELQAAQGVPLYPEQLVLAKVLAAENTSDSRSRALLVLKQLEGFATSIHNKPLLMEALAVQALLHEQDGDERAALTALDSAIELAQPGGWIRLFVDLGPRMARLIVRLEELSERGSASVYVEKILQAFLDAGSTLQSPHLEEMTAPLTNREFEILALLAERWSNREIADKLMISPKTVKRHTMNIYQKLKVNSRRQAASAAERLGLLRHWSTPAHDVYRLGTPAQPEASL